MPETGSTVAVIRCGSYDETSVLDAVREGVSLLGGAKRFVRPNEKILLKPNLLVGEPPEKCVTTHPAVCKAVARLCKEEGAILFYGDSPAVGTTAKVARKTGLLEVAEEMDIRPADFKTRVDVFFDKGIQNKRFTVAKAVLDSDAVISLPKLKTHGLEKITGAVKNQFGCIPGALKGEFHVRLPAAEDFATMLVDLNNFIHPRLYVMDGIFAMEGNGPRGGTPRKMNVLLFSEDPVALDATVCRLVHLDPARVPTIVAGMKSGAGTFLEHEIEIVGEDIRKLSVSDFDVNRYPNRPYEPGLLAGILRRRLVPKPYIRENKCIQCGLCVRMCPAFPKALAFGNDSGTKPPVYDYDNCIRCFCCQEICPEQAVVLKTPVLRKILNFLKIS